VAQRRKPDRTFAEFARQRHALIRTYPELHERELSKLASLASAMAEALRRRGVPEPFASLAAETGIAVFKVAFEQWTMDRKRRALAQHIRDSFRELRLRGHVGGFDETSSKAR
jgi:hypothetical protein